MWNITNDFLVLSALSALVYAVISAVIVMYYFKKYDCEVLSMAQPETQAQVGQNPYFQNLGTSSLFSFTSFFSPFFLVLVAIFFCFCFCLLLVFGLQVGVVVAAALLILGVIDYRFFALPDVLSFGFLALCVACVLVWDIVIASSFSIYVLVSDVISQILLGFGLGGIAFALKILFNSLTGRECLGEADILIISGMGVAMGAGMAFFALFIGSIFALLYAIVYAYHTQSRLFELRLPLCPFLCLGVVGTLILLLFLTF